MRLGRIKAGYEGAVGARRGGRGGSGGWVAWLLRAAPFSRTFFNVTLGDMLEKDGKEKDHKLTLFLTDGTTLDVCSIDELADQ
jgi:hypothetical protein